MHYIDNAIRLINLKIIILYERNQNNNTKHYILYGSIHKVLENKYYSGRKCITGGLGMGRKGKGELQWYNRKLQGVPCLAYDIS